MRLFLLPISTKQSLIYCQRINKQIQKEPTYIDKITTKASTTWLSWEQADKGWKKTVASYGNKLFQRLPHEEWGLKSIPPLSTKRQTKELEGKENARVEYPESVLSQDASREALGRFAAKSRQAFHTKWMWASLIGMPISAPIAAIPVLPNIPFFYLCFRAWSHWRARSGSEHLNFLLKNQLITLTPSKILDEIYKFQQLEISLKTLKSEHKAIQSPSASSPSGNPENPPNEKMLLSPSSGKLIADFLEVPDIEQEIERAIHQVEASLRAKRELDEEKSAIQKATEPKN